MQEAINLINNSEWESDGIQSTITFSNVEKLMIEFAKLHVEAALKEVIENAESVYDSEEDCFINAVDSDSILNAYPLTNIK
jgi:hypothetical protein